MPISEGIGDNACPASYLRIMGKPLIAHNINAAIHASRDKIERVIVPRKFQAAIEIARSYFPDIYVAEPDEEDGNVANNEYAGGIRSEIDTGLVRVPINSIIRPSIADGVGLSRSNGIVADSITYPWDFLKAIDQTLRDMVTSTYISPTAKISKTCIIDGPCVIEDDVVLDDFCKVKGPAYISKGSRIGMCSLVRYSMLGENTRIGFNCEVAKSFFLGDTKIAHQNVILDSIIGRGVWFGGYSATANVLITRDNVRYRIGETLVDTGTDHFGAVVGNNSTVGAYVLILPGRQLPPGSMIQAGTIISK